MTAPSTSGPSLASDPFRNSSHWPLEPALPAPEIVPSISKLEADATVRDVNACITVPTVRVVVTAVSKLLAEVWRTHSVWPTSTTPADVVKPLGWQLGDHSPLATETSTVESIPLMVTVLDVTTVSSGTPVWSAKAKASGVSSGPPVLVMRSWPRNAGTPLACAWLASPTLISLKLPLSLSDSAYSICAEPSSQMISAVFGVPPKLR